MFQLFSLGQTFTIDLSGIQNQLLKFETKKPSFAMRESEGRYDARLIEIRNAIGVIMIRH